MNSTTAGGYFAVASIDGGLTNTLQLEKDVVSALNTNPADVTYSVHINDELYVEDEALDALHTFHLPMKSNTSQTITTDYNGITKDGTPFERTVVEHLFTDERGNVFH